MILGIGTTQTPSFENKLWVSKQSYIWVHTKLYKYYAKLYNTIQKFIQTQYNTIQQLYKHIQTLYKNYTTTRHN